jgi:hypothetical protein
MIIVANSKTRHGDVFPSLFYAIYGVHTWDRCGRREKKKLNRNMGTHVVPLAVDLYMWAHGLTCCWVRRQARRHHWKMVSSIGKDRREKMRNYHATPKAAHAGAYWLDRTHMWAMSYKVLARILRLAQKECLLGHDQELGNHMDAHAWLIKFLYSLLSAMSAKRAL